MLSASEAELLIHPTRHESGIFLRKTIMGAIASLTIRKDLETTPTEVVLSPQGATPGITADWRTQSFPELGRVEGKYTFRKADPSTGLVKHSFRFTIPTLKQLVTDPGGPYMPPPAIDYVGVAEVNMWVHPRATEAERVAVVAAAMNGGSSLKSHAYSAVVLGETFY